MSSDDLSGLAVKNNLLDRIAALERKLESLSRAPVRANQVSEIAPDLGEFRLLRLLALSAGQEPTDLDACGVFMSAQGEYFLGVPWNIGGVNNGVLMFGLKAEDGAAYFSGGNGIIDATGLHMQGLGYFLDWKAVSGNYTRIGYIQMKLHGTNPAPALTIGQDNPEDVTLNPNPHFSSDAADWFGLLSIDGATLSYGEAFGNLAKNTTGDGYAIAVDADGNLIIGGSFTQIESAAIARISKYLIAGKRGTTGGYWYTPPRIYHPAVLIEAGHYETTSIWHPPELLPSPPYEPGLYEPGYYTYSQTWVPDRYSTAYYTQPQDVWIATGSWQALGTGLNGTCYGIAVAPNGDIYAVGAFTTAGGTTVNGVAKWDGTAWSALSTGLKKGGVAATGYCIAIDEDGDVYVGGDFDHAGATACANFAKWNGTDWEACGSGVNNIVRGLWACPITKNILLTGDFTSVDGAAHSFFAKWQPATTDYLTYADPSEAGKCILGDSNEYPIIGNTKVSRYNGENWDETGTSNGIIYALALDWMENIYAGGAFTDIDGVTVANLAYFDSYSGANAWYKIGTVDNEVRGLVFHNKNLFIAKLDSTGTDKGIINARVMDIRMTPKLTLSTTNVVSRTFSGFYKKPVDGWNTRFILNWYDSGGVFLEEQLLFSAVDACDWTWFSYDIIPPTDAVYVEFVVDMAMGTDQPDTNYTLDILEHLTELDSISFSEKISEEYQIFFQPYPMIRRGSEIGIIPSMSAFNIYAPLSAPAVIPIASDGNIDDGLHSWKVSNVDVYGETELSAKSNVINCATSADSYSKVLLHMDGEDGATTFTDESGKTWTAAGNAQIDTSQKKFGTASGLFDGAGDYISTPNSADLDFGSDDWTIDFWVRRNGSQLDGAGLFGANDGSAGYTIVLADGNIKVYATVGGTWTYLIAGTQTIPDLTWAHVALIRHGNTLTLYVNGEADAARVYDCTGKTFNSGGTGAFVGWNNNAGSVSRYFNGWLDEVRVSKGIARWTGDFTPPTEPYTSMLKQATIPLVAGPWGTTKRRIYRTKAGDTGPYYLVGEVADNTTTTFIDNIADEELVTEAPAVNTTASRPLFPRQAFKLWPECKANSALTQVIDTGQSLATYWKQTSCANGDTAEFDLYLEEGTYTLDILGVTNTTCGILDWYLDGILISAGQDWYAASATKNVKKTIAGITITGSGYHVLKAVVNGHNASAGTPYYNYMITSLNIYQASR